MFQKQQCIQCRRNKGETGSHRETRLEITAQLGSNEQSQESSSTVKFRGTHFQLLIMAAFKGGQERAQAERTVGNLCEGWWGWELDAAVRGSGVVAIKQGWDLLMEWIWVMKNKEAHGD